MFAHVFRRLFVGHEWSYRDHDAFRECSICGQVEKLDWGGGMAGGDYLCEVPGREGAHAAAFEAQERARAHAAEAPLSMPGNLEPSALPEALATTKPAGT